VIGALFVCAAACSHASSIDGEWGGSQASMAITAEGAMLEFPCATGRIEGAVDPDGDGRFDAEGTYSRLRGIAPSDESGVPAPSSATVRYTGEAHGDEMTITIRFRDAESETYVLKRGASATVPQCSEIRNPMTETAI
jgi:hypothetical protein